MKALETTRVEQYYKRVRYAPLRRLLAETEIKAQEEISEFPVISDFIKWDYLKDYMDTKFNPYDLSRTLVVDGFVDVDRRVFDRKPIHMVDKESERALRAVIAVQYFKNAERFYSNVVPLTIVLLGEHPIAQRLNNITVYKDMVYADRHRFLKQPWINKYDALVNVVDKTEKVSVEEAAVFVKRNGKHDLDPYLSRILARILQVSGALSRREALSLDEVKKTKELSEDDKTGALKLAYHYLDQYPGLYGNLGELYEDIISRAVIRPRALSGL